MGSRQLFDIALAEELAVARLRALTRALGDEPTLRDLCECLDDGAYPLDEDDPLTVGDLAGSAGDGPRIVEVLLAREMPLDSPLDAADDVDLDVPLRDLLAAASDG